MALGKAVRLSQNMSGQEKIWEKRMREKSFEQLNRMNVKLGKVFSRSMVKWCKLRGSYKRRKFWKVVLV